MNSLIRDFCSADDANSVKQLLDIFDNIDILYEDGIFFDLVIPKGLLATNPPNFRQSV